MLSEFSSLINQIIVWQKNLLNSEMSLQFWDRNSSLTLFSVSFFHSHLTLSGPHYLYLSRPNGVFGVEPFGPLVQLLHLLRGHREILGLIYSLDIQCCGSAFWPNSDLGLCTFNEGWFLKCYWMNILANVASLLFVSIFFVSRAKMQINNTA